MEMASESGGSAPSVQKKEGSSTDKKEKKEKKRKDSFLGDFEPPEERAKRIRKERKLVKEKDAEEEKKREMTKAIGTVLTLNPNKPNTSTPTKAPKAAPGPAGPSFQSFGVGPAVPSGPSVAAGPGRPDAGNDAGPSAGPSAGPLAPGASTDPAASSFFPTPRPRGPMRPSAEDLKKPLTDEAEEDATMCPEGHTLKTMATPDKGWKCSTCEEEVERGSFLWGCVRCMYYVCPKCMDIRKAKANYVPPVVTEPTFAETRPMDYLKEKKRVSWDELKERLEKAENLKEEGVPGAKSFDDFAAALQQTRDQRLEQQEGDTKAALRHVNARPDKKAKKEKKDKKEKKEKSKGPKRTADGALLGESSGDDSSQEEDKLLARYKLSAHLA